MPVGSTARSYSQRTDPVARRPSHRNGGPASPPRRRRRNSPRRRAFRGTPRGGGHAETDRGPRRRRRPSSPRNTWAIRHTSPKKEAGWCCGRRREKQSQDDLARRMHVVLAAGQRLGSRHREHDIRSGASDLIPAAGCQAPDSCGHDRALLSGSEAPLLFGFRPSGRSRAEAADRSRTDRFPRALRRHPTGRRGDPGATLDCGGRRALLCGVLGSLDAAARRGPRVRPAGPA